MQSEIENARKRWNIFLKIVRDTFPYCNIEILDRGRKNRYWKISIRIKKDNLNPLIIIKVRNKIMTHPEVDFRGCFLKAMKEAEHILSVPIPPTEFYGTLFIDVENISYHEEVDLNDDWW